MLNGKIETISGAPSYYDKIYPESKELASRLLWYHVKPPDDLATWAQQIAWTRDATITIARRLAQADLLPILNFYGPFEKDGIAGLVAEVTDIPDVPRYYLPPVNYPGGAGYVYSDFNVEFTEGFAPVFLRERFLGGGGIQVTLGAAPKEHAEILLTNSWFSREGRQILFPKVRCVVDPDNDFDSFDIGMEQSLSGILD